MGAGVTLLSEEEAPGSGATATDAAAFLRTHTQAFQVRRLECFIVRTPWTQIWRVAGAGVLAFDAAPFLRTRTPRLTG